MTDFIEPVREHWYQRNRKLKTSSKDIYLKYSFAKFCRFMTENFPEAGVSFDVGYLDQWVDSLEQDGLRSSTIQQRIIGTLRVARYALDHHFIPDVHVPHTSSVDLASVTSDYGPILKPDELMAFYETAPQRQEPTWNSSRSRSVSLRDSAFVAVACDLPDTELHDLLALEIDALHLAERTLSWHENLLRLSDDTIARLRDYRASLTEQSTHLFTSYSGNPFTYADAQIMLAKRARAFGIQVPRHISRFGDLSESEREMLRAQKILCHCDLHQQLDQVAMRFLSWTGARSDETCAVRVDKVDSDMKLVEFHITKSGRPQQMPIALEFQEEFFGFVASLPRHEKHVFFSETGQRISRNFLFRLVKTHGVHCGISRVTLNPRMIRRTMARWMRQNGASDQHIELFLRHSPSTVAKNHYSPVEAINIAPALEHHPLRRLLREKSQTQFSTVGLATLPLAA